MNLSLKCLWSSEPTGEAAAYAAEWPDEWVTRHQWAHSSGHWYKP